MSEQRREEHAKQKTEQPKENDPYLKGDHYASDAEIAEVLARGLFLSVNPYNPKDFEKKK